MFIFFLLLLHLLVLCSSGDLASCTSYEEQQVELCLKPMLNFAQSLQSTKLWPLEGLKVFDELCEMYREFEHCVAKLECESNGAKAMHTSYGYMCGAGYHMFAQHVNCYVQVENADEYAVCKDAATRNIANVKAREHDQTVYFVTLCNSMLDYMSCSRPLIIGRCGQQAWDLIAKVTQDSLAQSLPACHYHDA